MLGLRGFLGWDDAKALLLHICSCAHAVVQPRPPIQCCPHCRSCICLFNLFWSPSAFAMPVVPQCTGVRTASLHFRKQCCSSAPWTAGSTQVRRHYSAGTQAQKNVGVFLPLSLTFITCHGICTVHAAFLPPAFCLTSTRVASRD